MDANAERGERVLAEARAMRAAVYNAQHAAQHAQNVALKKLHAESMASIERLSRSDAARSAPKSAAAASDTRDADEPMPDRWLE